MPEKMSQTMTVGRKLVELCNQGQFLQAINELYDDSIHAIEPCAMPGMDQDLKGIDAIRQKSQGWSDNHEVHSCAIKGPFPHGDRFALLMNIDVTPKAGPMANQRMQMEEVCLYTVANGKIVKEEFFYDTE
ncbi:nuclear transport factor 2 family protein [Mucisphaera calidilacus]|uniref:SnoaL-like domain protein n=1 Tax=Mucisphaera calidilacus TaxID=2527982 RepID=A0A518BZ30_9BACT|nr:nuclear transport factor 2 family protein [Mucisphaera calidilacus]QDU72226.1 SnoaL-like domain protein [Mucisphaera calidilacus]